VQILQNLEVARQLVREREASLRATPLPSGAGSRGDVRRRLGRQLVRIGTWLANEQPMQPAAAG
jgi:hypothetical protein